VPFTTDPSRWYYSGEHRSTYTDKLQPGDIIVAKRRPYRIREIKPRPHVNWGEEYLAAWEKSGQPDPETWWHRPFVLVLTEEDKPNSKREFHCEAAGSQYWTVLPEHYAVCRLCGELPPCRDVHTDAVVEHATAKMNEAMQILPGACHACREQIRPRQGSIRFEGENLIRPDLGNNSAVFHTRRQCFGAAFDYDKKWAVAEPGRRGKLHCVGLVVHHFDGSNECSLGVGCAGPMDALGEWMRHRGGETWHSAGRGYADDCWCTSGGERPASVVVADDKTLF